MSGYIRAYTYGTIVVVIGFAFVSAMLLLGQDEVARFTVILVSFLGGLVAALVAPRRGYLLGLSILPVISAALCLLALAWNAYPLPGVYAKGVAVAMYDVNGMSAFWVAANAVGAALGWAIRFRRATLPNKSLERSRAR